jgi:hypothetical protein
MIAGMGQLKEWERQGKSVKTKYGTMILGSSPVSLKNISGNSFK